MTNQGSLISALTAALGAGYESTPYNVDPVVDGVSLTGAAHYERALASAGLQPAINEQEVPQ